MATPAQRRKVRNPSRKVSRKTANLRHRKKPIPQGPAADAILPHWSNKASVRENYAKLGLMLRLNGSAGGTKDTLKDHLTVNLRDLKESCTELDGGYMNDTSIVSEMISADDEIEEGVIEKDENGNVIGYKIVRKKKDSPVVSQTDDSVAAAVIKNLEERAASGVKAVYSQPPGEIMFVKECVQKYGNDFGKMARDIKLNSLQLTKAQIQKKVERFLRETSQ